MSTDLKLIGAEWITSSYSQGDGGQCVEFSPSFAGSGVIPVRDSKNPDGPTLLLPTGGWSSFVSAVKGRELPAA
jgi:hypothetical protein